MQTSKFIIHVNPQHARGSYPNENKKGYYFEIECRIDVKPGCKFKFLCCLEVYVKKIGQGLLKYVSQAPFQGPYRASMKVQEGTLVHIMVPGYQKKLLTIGKWPRKCTM